jgi:SSS family solute:Na+ symporter
MDIHIRTPDAVAIAIYLIAMLGIGVVSARRSTTAENYFVGRRSFPGWAVALSMLATIVSSGTFLALPAAAYVLDWRQLTVNLMVPVVAVLAAIVFIPFFRRAGLTSAFEYLGDRFGTGARLYAAISFSVLQQVRLAQMLFLVALPMQFLTGAPLAWVICGCGIFVALYSLMGGMETVFWAGVVQALIMIGGGVLCLVFVVGKLPGGFTQVIEAGQAQGKFSLGSFTWNAHERTFFTVAILGIVNWLTIYSSEQSMVQRYVSASSLREARKATLLFSAIAVPMWTMFFFIGTALFVYFQTHADPVVAQLQPDQVLPYFVFTQIPAGLGGVVIAAVLSAAMSSLDSGVNSISTVVVVDLIKPHLAPNRSDRFYLAAARVGTATSILLMTLGALLFSGIKKESMNDVSLTMASIFGGCLMGLYLTGFFLRRVDGVAVNLALVVAVAVNIFLGLGFIGVLPAGWTMQLHSYWFGPLVNAIFIGLAVGISLVRRKPPADRRGLTVWG